MHPKDGAKGPGVQSLRQWLVNRVARETRTEPSQIGIHTPFASFGLGSAQAVILAGELEEMLGRELPATLAWEYPTIAELADFLVRDPSSPAPHGVEEIDPAPLEPIAIVGIACRLPGATGPQAFWDMLCQGREAVVEVPSDRWDVEEYFDPTPGTPGKTYARRGGFIDNIDLFDPGFFGISPREATRMDPQQRMLLELAWNALEDAGIDPGTLHGSRTGVFVGITGNDYGRVQMNPAYTDMYMPTGNATSIAANRISYFFNFRGPSMIVDTACSSSLVALHLACKSLWNHEAAAALAGGTNLILSPTLTINLSLAGMLSKEGRCKAFDASADGFVRGEGAGFVLLKPLSRALADGDSIYATVLATSVNSDGRSNGITAPNRESQEAALRDACRRAGIRPAAIDYMEAHGTGTVLGDPIEASAIGAVLGVGRDPERPILLGSVKTNIGHLEGAAGIAGIIKAALCLRHRQIPPSLHFKQPNPNIPFDRLPLRVQTQLASWPAWSEGAIAGVSSFGFGGTNACAILAEAPRQAPRAAALPSPFPHVLVLSAHDQKSLPAVAKVYADFLRSDENQGIPPEDICYTAALHRKHFPQRLAVTGRDLEDLASGIEAFVSGVARANVCVGAVVTDRRPRVAFMFPGQGTQWPGMGRRLFEYSPAFRQAVEEVDGLFHPLASWSIIEEMARPAQESRLEETACAQPALFALQTGLAALWKSWGIAPDAVIGHSMGEAAAAYVAGALSLDDAVKVIYHRSRLMQRATGTGQMVSISLPLAEVKTRLAAYGGRIGIGAVNSPASIVVSGESDAVDQLLDELTRDRVAFQPIARHYAFHSHLMEPFVRELEDALAPIAPRAAAIPIYSTVAGERIDDGSMLDASYWGRNLRQTVLFQPAVDSLLEDGIHVLLECSPHPTLRGPARQCIRSRGANAVTVESLRKDEDAAAIHALGALHVAGLALDHRTVFPGAGTRVSLPTYPWQRQRCWLELGEADMWQGAWKGASARGAHPFKPRKTDAPTPTWQFDLDMQALAFLRDHQVQGSPILPATAFLEMALVAAKAHFGSARVVLSDVSLLRPLGLSEGRQETYVVFDSASTSDVSFRLYSRHVAKGTIAAWTLHATGSASTLSAEGNGRAHGLTEDRAAALRRGDTVTSGPFYEALRARGYEYGPHFQGVEAVWRNNGEALGRLRPVAAQETVSQPYEVHPAVLDSALQVLGMALASQPDDAGVNAVYLPVHLDQALVHEEHGVSSWAHTTLRKQVGSGQQIEGDFALYNSEYGLVAELRGLRLQRVESKEGDKSRDTGNPADWLFDLVWEPKPAPGSSEVLLPRSTPALRDLVDAIAAEARSQNEIHAMQRYEAGIGCLDALVSAHALNALVELGWSWMPGDAIVFDALCARLGIAPRHEKAVNRLLEMLEEDGLLARDAEKWRVDAELEPVDTCALHSRLLAAYPSLLAELELCRACGQQLGAILSGKKDALSVIFPEGSLALVERLYADSPFSRANNALVKRALAHVVDSLPSGHVLRILEIGAGTGGLTSHVLPSLPRDRVKYTFTDVASVFLGQAEQKFRPHASFVEYKLLDIEKSPESQGFETPHAFDVVIAANVLHATADLRATLHHVRSLLAPQGLLILIEGTGKRRLLDLVFGLTEGWWRFTDRDLRQTHPLISSECWHNLFKELGFVDSFDSEGYSEGSRISRQPVLIAEAPAHAPAEVAPQVLTPKEESGLWVLLADSTGVASQLAEDLRSLGERVSMVYPERAYAQRAEGVYHVAPHSASDFEQMLRDAGECASVVRGVLHLWALDSADSAGSPSAASAHCASALAVYKALTAIQHAPAPRLYLVTRYGQPVRTEEPACHPAQATLWGLAKVMTFENPALRCTAVDLGNEPSNACAATLLGELWCDDAEDRVAFREGHRYVQRLTSWSPSRATGISSREIPIRLENARPGAIEGIAIRAAHRATPGPGEVEIAVKAAALNFRDILKAIGMYYPLREGEHHGLGDECSGIVTAVGANVTGIKPGDEVIAMARDSFSSIATAHQMIVVPKPDGLTFEEAAGVQVAYLTALYSLRECAKLRRGERVLIHAGAGGVGLAAIQIAQWMGAEVFATAGSAEKREYLRAIGVPHVMDSRTLHFAEEIDSITAGRGVDVVLNSLAGKALQLSVECLARFGRFVEIGKRDIYENTALGLRPFSKLISFTAVDLGRVIEHSPDVARQVLDDIVTLMNEGVLSPLPLRVFTVDEAQSAFRYMAQARHIGKVVLTMRHHPALPPGTVWRQPEIRPDSAYMITGAFGGFGSQVARWLADCGARHLALMSRSGASSEPAIELVRALESRSVTVTVLQGDVAREDDVRRAFARMRESMPPLRGLIHAAMVIDDESLAAMTAEKMERVLAPKVNGAWNLHQETLALPLDFFVLFSSGAALAGSPGQGNYVAANAYLDALAHHRHTLGLPALSVNWGRIANVGYVAEHQDVADRLTRLGFEGIPPRDGLKVLGELMAGGAVQAGVVRTDWSKWRDFYPGGEDFPLIRRLASKNSRAENGTPGLSLEALRSSADREAALRLYLSECLGQVLALDPESLDMDKSLDALGLDSIAGMELKSKIESDFSLSLPMAMLVQGPAIAQFAKDLLKLILDTHGLPAAPAAPAAAAAGGHGEEGEI